jgi:GAF domain-containing protein
VTDTQKSGCHKLIGSLSLLSCYLQKLDEDETMLLYAVAPHASFEHNADRLIEQLERLVDKNPSTVYNILTFVLSNFASNFDFEDRLKSIIKSSVAHGFKASAFELADNLRHLRGMKELFSELDLLGRR